jgi:hypothetical protein
MPNTAPTHSKAIKIRIGIIANNKNHKQHTPAITVKTAATITNVVPKIKIYLTRRRKYI